MMAFLENFLAATRSEPGRRAAVGRVRRGRRQTDGELGLATTRPEAGGWGTSTAGQLGGWGSPAHLGKAEGGALLVCVLRGL